MKPLVVAALFASLTAFAGGPFSLTSTDLHEGQPLGDAQVGNAFGCSGGNVSPQLSWTNAPEGTRSFAVTVYDPDAPTGSGWWHWVLYDLPATTRSLPAGVKAELPAKQGRNDGGAREFGGACPPPGDKPHHYVVTVFALKVESLPLPPEASSAMIGYMLNANALAKAKLTATFKR